MNSADELDRYSRQTLLPEIGIAGQEQLLASLVAVVGCEALGTVIASAVVRAGVGQVRIVDRDYIELNNLQRQILFDEEDIARGLPKAVAAAEKLRKVNSQIEIEPVVADVNPDNVERIVDGVDLVLDGTDNLDLFSAQRCLCQARRSLGVRWGAWHLRRGLGHYPPSYPLFSLFLASIASARQYTYLCDTMGVLASAANVIAALEVVEGFKILLGKEKELYGKLLYIDVWGGSLDGRAIVKGTADESMARTLYARDLGLSIAVDPYGRILTQTDFFGATDRTLVTQVPVRHVTTI